jgi:XisI protein
MAELKQILREAMQDYAGEALNGHLYLTSNDNEGVFTIMSIANVRSEKIVETGIVARIEYETIIIEHDISNKPLIDALVQAGIPREQIILAYAGETVRAVS